MPFLTVIRRIGTGYSADLPDLPGCVATGNTVEHTRERLADVIEMNLEMMQQAGASMPAPSTTVELALEQDGEEELWTRVEIDEARAVVG